MNTERSLKRDATIRDIARSGTSTTEYEAAQSGSWWGIVAFLLGLVGTYGAQVVAAMGGTDSTWGIVAGALIALAGLAGTVLSKLGYIKARADVKVAAADAVAAEAQADAVAEAAVTPAAPVAESAPAAEVDPIAGLTRM